MYNKWLFKQIEDATLIDENNQENRIFSIMFDKNKFE
jgi:hypothetical protein